MPTKTTRTRLTGAQKEALREHHRAHPDKTLLELCEWALATFALQRAPSQSTLFVLFTRAERAFATNPATKTNRNVTCARLEAELVRWISRCERVKIALVTQAAIRAKAKKIRSVILQDPTLPPNSALSQLSFSNGWLQKLQRRHGLKSRRLHGEAASASVAAIEKGRALLQ